MLDLLDKLISRLNESKQSCGFVDESKYIELKNTEYSNDSYKTTISGVIKNGDSELEIKNQEIELTQKFGNLWYTTITFDDETKNIKLNGEKDIITAVPIYTLVHIQRAPSLSNKATFNV